MSGAPPWAECPAANAMRVPRARGPLRACGEGRGGLAEAVAETRALTRLAVRFVARSKS